MKILGIPHTLGATFFLHALAQLLQTIAEKFSGNISDSSLTSFSENGVCISAWTEEGSPKYSADMFSPGLPLAADSQTTPASPSLSAGPSAAGPLTSPSAPLLPSGPGTLTLPSCPGLASLRAASAAQESPRGRWLVASTGRHKAGTRGSRHSTMTVGPNGTHGSRRFHGPD